VKSRGEKTEKHTQQEELKYNNRQQGKNELRPKY
jgi:hypothetical protein